jgi:hypothetical protein
MDGANGGSVFVDNGCSQHALTATDAVTDTSTKQFGKSSCAFNGTSSFIDIADSADFTFGTGDFTCEMFVRFNSFGQYVIFSTVGAADSGFIRLQWNESGGGWAVSINAFFQTFADTISTDTWYHVAFARSGTDVRLWRDGVQKGTTQTNSDSIDPNGGIRLGRERQGFTFYFDGYMDEIRFIKGQAVSSGSTYPVPAQPYANCEDSSSSLENSGFSSSSSSTEGFTSSSSTSSLEFSSFSSSSSSTSLSSSSSTSSSLEFSSFSSSSSTENNFAADFGTGGDLQGSGIAPGFAGPDTMSVWVYPTNVSGTQQIVNRYWGFEDFMYQLTLEPGGTPEFRFLVRHADDLGASSVGTSSLGAIQINTWYLVTFWHDATNDELGIALNDGDAVTLAYTDGVNGGSTTMRWGHAQSPAIESYSGRIGSSGFWNKILTDQERYTLYNGGSGLIHSELSGSLLTNLGHYWNMEEASGTRADSAGALPLIVTSGGPGRASGPQPDLNSSWSSSSTEQSLTSSSSSSTSSSSSSSSSLEFSSFSSSSTENSGAASFNGTNQHLNIADNASLSIGDIDFTLVCWVYFDTLPTVGTNAAFFGKNAGAGNQRAYQLFYNSTEDRIRFCLSSDGTDTNQTCVDSDQYGAPSTNTWYMVTATHDATANEISIRINDHQPDTLSHNNGSFDNTSEFRIGSNAAGSNFLDGRCSRAGIWKNRVLTQSEITQLFNAGNGYKYADLPSGFTTNLESYWDLDEASGTRSDSHGSNDLGDNNSVGIAGGPYPDENTSFSSSS